MVAHLLRPLRASRSKIFCAALSPACTGSQAQRMRAAWSPSAHGSNGPLAPTWVQESRDASSQGNCDQERPAKQPAHSVNVQVATQLGTHACDLPAQLHARAYCRTMCLQAAAARVSSGTGAPYPPMIAPMGASTLPGLTASSAAASSMPISCAAAGTSTALCTLWVRRGMAKRGACFLWGACEFVLALLTRRAICDRFPATMLF